jgi:peptidoglycan/LPS O-acetylase OafA/YrhL
MAFPNTKFLDGTRFLFALWVILGHFFFYIGGSDLIQIPLLGPLILSPGVAVDGFMVVTSFLMMYHYILRSTLIVSPQI